MFIGDRNIIPMRLEKCRSTNDQMKFYIDGDPTWGTVFPILYARKQTSGRGRGPGKTWWSPKDAGLYLSLVLKAPDYNPDITTVVGQRVVQCLRDYTKLNIKQRGINDIYLKQKKLGGILCEIYKKHLIIGIGLNLFKPKKIPLTLRNKAIWLNEIGSSVVIDSWEIMKVLATEFLK